MFFISFVL